MAFWKTLGSVVRQTGQALESAGLVLQRPYGYREQRALQAQANTLVLLMHSLH